MSHLLIKGALHELEGPQLPKCLIIKAFETEVGMLVPILVMRLNLTLNILRNFKNFR